jgi:glycine cleavage system H protein
MSARFTDEHEWITLEGDVATIGITDFAQNQLGDIVFVELPEVGKDLKTGDEAAVVESVKAASELYAPLDGVVVETNPALEAAPESVNSDPTGSWFFKLKITNPAAFDELLDADAYQALIS